jgi:glycosyltransferase involved in cell wall biosynthesis
MNSGKDLHIISFNIPFPANYGGVIDVFYKLKALHKLGVNIHLHCFSYGRVECKELEKYCEKVYYYPRNMSWVNIFSRTPFIIKSRSNKLLTKRLKELPFPILYEGLHCCMSLENKELKQKKYIRAHNVETHYYRQLAKNESNLFSKLFLYSEYLKIRKYEKTLKIVDGIFSISNDDKNHFSKSYNSHLIRAFHSNKGITSKTGIGKYALYHGNLTVSENINAAFFLVKLSTQSSYPLIIAGKKPSEKLIEEIKKYKHIQLCKNPTNEEMDKLIRNAQMVLLPTKQNTGIKLKLLESLYKSRFCIVNNTMVSNTELESYCIEANSNEDWFNSIEKYKSIEFSDENIKHRKEICSIFNNEKEAQKIIDIIFA